MTLLRSEIVRARGVQERLAQARQLKADLDAEWELAQPALPAFDDAPAEARETLIALVGEKEAKELYEGVRQAPGAAARLTRPARAGVLALLAPATRPGRRGGARARCGGPGGLAVAIGGLRGLATGIVGLAAVVGAVGAFAAHRGERGPPGEPSTGQPSRCRPGGGAGVEQGHRRFAGAP